MTTEKLDVYGMDQVDQVRWLAVFIQSTSPHQRHVGFLYRNGDHQPWLLHLADHHDLRHEPAGPSDTITWLPPGLPDEETLFDIASQCILIAEDSSTLLPYGLDPPQQLWDPQTHTWRLGGEGIGVTCATFVLGVLLSLGYPPLLDTASWPPRDEDQRWMQRIVAHLARVADPAHVDSQRARLQSACRFRPEEVAAAFHVAPPALNQQRAAGLGERLLTQLPPP